MLMRMKQLSMATTISLIPLVPSALPRYSSHLKLKWKVLYLIGYTFITLFPKKYCQSKGRNPLNFLRYAIGRILTHALTKLAHVLGHALVPVKINTYLFSFQKGNLLIYIFIHIGGIDVTHIFLFITSENNQLPLSAKVKWSSQSQRKGRHNPCWSMRSPFCLFLVGDDLLLNKNLIGYPTGSQGLTKLNRLACKDSRLSLITCIAFPDLEELSFRNFDFYILSSLLNWPPKHVYSGT